MVFSSAYAQYGDAMLKFDESDDAFVFTDRTILEFYKTDDKFVNTDFKPPE